MKKYLFHILLISGLILAHPGKAQSIQISGSILTKNSELDIRTGGDTISLTVSGDFWALDIGNDNSNTRALINAFTGNLDWGKVTTALNYTNVTRVSYTLVHIILPSVSTYNISSVETVSLKVPATCFLFKISGTIAGDKKFKISVISPTATINDPGLSEVNLNGANLMLQLEEETFSTTSPPASAFTHSGPSSVTISGVIYQSSTKVLLTLGFNGNIDTDITNFKITVAGSVLSGFIPLTTNGITITAVAEPEIINVSLPQDTFGIGENVRVSIDVGDDLGRHYTYYSGTVAERTLDSITRQSGSTYYGYFRVNEGDTDYFYPQPIPVVNLRLDAGVIPGISYSGQISQSGYLIDGHPPLINYMQAPGSLRKIGDQVDIIVSADGSSYAEVPNETLVNSIPSSDARVGLLNLGSGVYILRYTVTEGDNDVGPGGLTAKLRLKDLAGNKSSVFTALTSNTVAIDANSPVVSKVTVPDSIFSIGEIINAKITADGSDYTSTGDTYINGVPISSTKVNFTHVSGNLYNLAYVVSNNDQEVEPNTIDIKVYLRDAAGNISTVSPPVDFNSLAIFSKLPTAKLSGNHTICEGDSAELTASLTGNKPWEIYVTDGTNLKIYSNIFNAKFKFWVKPVVTSTYIIASVTDSRGQINEGTGSGEVTVNPKTPVQITNLNTSYNVESDPIALQANVSGGTFTGPGVSGPPWFFDPGIAGTANSPHIIRYSYTNSSGCASFDTALVFVLGAKGVLYVPKDIYCNYNNPFTVSASNGAGNIGTFTLKNSSNQTVNGLTDHHDNTASIDPSLLNSGNYNILYQYVQLGTTLSLTKSFSIEAVQKPQITLPVQNTFCQNALSTSLRSDISTAIFSGPGVTGNVSNGFVFNPSEAFPGENLITCSNSSTHGCVRSTTKTININYIPDVNFTTDKTCVGAEDTVFFTNITENKYTISSWKWDFNDPSSGSANQSSLESPYHIYSISGSKNITLRGTTDAGCSDSLLKTVNFISRPSGTFWVANDCFIDGDSTIFKSGMEPASEISKYTWKFYLPDDQVKTISGGPTITYLLGETGEYHVGLETETVPGCSQTIDQNVYLKPTVLLASTSYFENFESTNGKWISGQDLKSQYIGWKYGVPDYQGLGDNTTKAWYIQHTANAGVEKSFMYSPCYNFTGLDRPMIRMNIFRSMVNNTEGAVLQGSLDNNNWITIGNLTDGINWYNSDQITGLPGTAGKGWTGMVPFNPDTAWVEARHDLNILADSSQVRLRIAFTSDNNVTSGNEGFAFDNVWIGPRTRKVLLEHFTNGSDTHSRTVNSNVNFIFNKNYKDLVKLEYHTDFPGFDPFNEQNEAVPATRTFYYGISSVPFSILEGGEQGTMRFDYMTSSLTEGDVNIESLTDPKFKLKLSVQQSGGSVSASVDVIALSNLAPDERILQVAVYEKLVTDVTTQNGENSFLHIIKAFLPNAAGTAIFDGWTKGETKNYQFNWEIETVYDPSMIRVAAFIQNDNTREIYQAITDDTTNFTTATNAVQAGMTKLYLYPNPAMDRTSVYLSTEGHKDYTIEFFDQLGRMVLSMKWYDGDIVRDVDLTGMQRGIYYIRLRDNHGNLRGYSKLVILK